MQAPAPAVSNATDSAAPASSVQVEESPAKLRDMVLNQADTVRASADEQFDSAIDQSDDVIVQILQLQDEMARKEHQLLLLKQRAAGSRGYVPTQVRT